ncbi:MAG: hypothetical protein J0L63_06570 [Anaerolineae bacterium]|nr:hypothetical protein [Anaerolineae bacterium]
MMRNALLSKFVKRTLRRGQTGQTIVIMAFGFVVLLAFVGIVTDVSLLFVRYSTLRRAVDAAAVAAAGQMRRTVPTADELARAGNNVDVAEGYAFARNITNINLAARQFIEFYGLSPTTVWVKTCATDPDDLELECAANQQPRKLVRVTAQIGSPTIFLRLIGWGSITLEATSISETAVLDIVMIFDGSESMLNQTTYDEWDAIGKGMRYLPPRLNSGPNINGGNGIYTTWPAPGGDYIRTWRTILNMTQSQITADQTNFPVTPFKWNSATSSWVISNFNDSANPRAECRVRFFPYAQSVGPAALPTELRNSYTSFLQSRGVIGGSSQYPDRYDAFIPAYDFYGCCNDPNGDWDFSDLICEPFKQVRDATEKFLTRVDFVRGDRVAFVNFDRTAFLIDPDGISGGASGTGPQLPMITSEENAVEALNRLVGVRAEPGYYADTNNDGLWDSYVIGGTAYNPADPANSGVAVSYTQTFNFATNSWQSGGYDNTVLGTLNDYPVANNCFLQNATLLYPFSLYSSQPTNAMYAVYGPGGTGNVSYPIDPSQPQIDQRWPSPLAAMNTNPTLMNPNLNDAVWDASMNASGRWSSRYSRQVAKSLFSYEFRAGCAGSNVGAALRVGSNALLDPRTVRIGNTGAVWVMVMLGDGAAAGSDPVQRNQTAIVRGNPYGDPNSAPSSRGQYGSYGLCPYGEPGNPSGLVDGWDTAPPRCMDNSPMSRHTCTDSAIGDPNNAIIDIATSPECELRYDVDDYARDWADFIALAEIPPISPFGGTSASDDTRSILQLPTIFTIGFGLDFPNGTGSCSDNINDCLGEELLRYIADVGDNNRIDTDFQQDFVEDAAADGVTGDGNLAFGERGPCEAAIPGYANAAAAYQAGASIYNPLPPKQNCGNYYNAPGGDQLEKVFEDIASRMFTRITR